MMGCARYWNIFILEKFTNKMVTNLNQIRLSDDRKELIMGKYLNRESKVAFTNDSYKKDIQL